jgi:hypothetical protein
MGERVRFEAILQPEGSSTFVVVPDEIGTRIGVKGRTSVVGTLNGHPFKNQVMPYGLEGGAKALFMPVNNAVRKAIGAIAAGDTGVFELERDEASRSKEVRLPAELEQALSADDSLRAAWDAQSPSRRRDDAEHIAEAKRPETRAGRLAELVGRLRGAS